MYKIIALLLLSFSVPAANAAPAEGTRAQNIPQYTGTYFSFDPVSGEQTGRLELEETGDGRLKFKARISRTSMDCVLSGEAELSHQRWQQWVYSDSGEVCRINIRRKGEYIHLIPGSLLDCRDKCPVSGGFAMVFPAQTRLASR